MFTATKDITIHIRNGILTDVQHEIIGTIIGFTGILGIWLNVALIVNIRKQTKKEILVGNLAVANLGLCIFAFPFSASSSFVHEWIFGNNMCLYYGFTSLFFGFVMMTSLAMIAVDEHLLFDWGPYIIKRNKVSKIMIAYTWINSLFWSVTPLVGWTSFGYEPSGTSCTVVYFPNDGYTAYMIGCSTACYLLPIVSIYYCKLRNHINNSSKRTKSTTMSKRTLSLLISFIICWTPYTIVYLWPIFTSNDVPFALSVVSPLIAKLHTVITPIIFLNTLDDTLKVE